MADNIEEKVSALVDGELPHEEADQIFQLLKQDRTSQACWRHYHLISDALKNNLPDNLPEDFVSRVAQSLDAEPRLVSPPRSISKHKPLHVSTIGFALAASVAAVVFIGLGWNTQTTVEQNPALIADATPPAVVSSAQVVSYTKVHGRQWDVEQPAVISKLNTYLLNHDQFSSMAEMGNGVLPQARIVGYERPDNLQQDSDLGNIEH